MCVAKCVVSNSDHRIVRPNVGRVIGPKSVELGTNLVESGPKWPIWAESVCKWGMFGPSSTDLHRFRAEFVNSVWARPTLDLERNWTDFGRITMHPADGIVEGVPMGLAVRCTAGHSNNANLAKHRSTTSIGLSPRVAQLRAAWPTPKPILA